jgi:hypothetical protein
MPYVTRDATGRIIALAETAPAEGAEHLPPAHAEVLDFLFTDADDSTRRFLASDLALIRVVEDVVEVLVRKRVIAMTDLPAAAQDKLMDRRSLRSYLSGMSGLVEGDLGKVI